MKGRKRNQWWRLERQASLSGARAQRTATSAYGGDHPVPVHRLSNAADDLSQHGRGMEDDPEFLAGLIRMASSLEQHGRQRG